MPLTDNVPKDDALLAGFMLSVKSELRKKINEAIRPIVDEAVDQAARSLGVAVQTQCDRMKNEFAVRVAVKINDSELKEIR